MESVVGTGGAMWLKIAGFAAISALLVTLTRRSLRRTSHGLYRLLAWECLLALFLLNVERWFVDPFSTAQLASWTLLTASAVLAIHGAALLRHRGRPGAARSDDHLIAFERTTVLVTSGAYRYVRHPMYASLLLLGWGIFLKDPSWPGLGLVLAASAFLTALTRVEEAENVRFFGVEYVDYMAKTKRFVPLMF